MDAFIWSNLPSLNKFLLKAHSDNERIWNDITDPTVVQHAVFNPVAKFIVRPFQGQKILVHLVLSCTMTSFWQAFDAKCQLS